MSTSKPSNALIPNFPANLEFYRPFYPHLTLSSPVSPLTSTQVIQHSFIHINVSASAKEPSIKVHATPSETSAVIGDVKFNATSSTKLTVYESPELGSEIEATQYELGHESDVHFFSLPNGENGEEERYEWLYSEDPETKDLATVNIPPENFSQVDHGLKLIRASNPMEIIAVSSTGMRDFALNPRKIVSKLRFLKDEAVAGEVANFRLIVILSVLSMVERGRQQAAKANQSWCVVL